VSETRSARQRRFPRTEDPGISDFHAFFRETPGLYLVLDPDLTIVDASDEYLGATLTWREEIRGCNLFDVFPDNPSDTGADGVKNLRTSLREVLTLGVPHRMAIQRYDVRDQISGDGGWVERFWAPLNAPVFGSGSEEITHLVHQVTDVTQAVLLRRWIDEQVRLMAEQRATLEETQRRVMRRQRELQAARKPLNAMVRRRGPPGASPDEIARRLGAPDFRRYLHAGERAPESAIYHAYHRGGCAPSAERVFMPGGTPLPRCARCQDAVLYRVAGGVWPTAGASSPVIATGVDAD